VRIISTVPSITELLYDLDLDKEVVGITKFCIHPASWFQAKDRIGGTKNLNLDKIISLRPTLVISNKEENTKEQIESIRSFSKVYLTDIKTPEDNLKLIKDLGALTDRKEKAALLEIELQAALHNIQSIPYKSALYLIWKDPYMTVGNDTYIHALMQKCGLRNCYSDELRYPKTTLKIITKLNPELILLSSEPYPFKEQHRLELESLVPNSNVHLVDGEVFSWYGTRLIKKTTYLNNLLNQFIL